MEALIAALIGWIDTSDSIIDLRTGLQIVNTGDDLQSACEITFPSGDSVVYTGPDADAILDRAEALAVSGKALVEQLNKMTAAAGGGLT